MLKTAAIAASVAVAGALAATYILGSGPFQSGGTNACSESTVAGADIGGPFELVNTRGATVTDQDVITEPSLIYFGYTFCPDVCPFDVARNVDAVDLLKEQGVSAKPVFITIDPERDTQDVLADYEYNLEGGLVALTGSPEQIAAASKAYKTYYKPQYDGTDDYLVDHSTFTYLVLPEKGFVEFFRRDITAEQMAQTVACFARES